jgi:putative phage-type endonuclease
MPLTEEQLAFRRGKVTASDMPAILGMDPYGRTVHDVVHDKRHQREKKETIPIRIGNASEPLILQFMSERKGLVLKPGLTIANDELPFLAATPDSMALDAALHPMAPCEAKVAGLRALRLWGDDETDETPDYVTVQCTTQMIVTKTKKCYVGVLLGTDFRMFEIEYNDRLASIIVDAARAFNEDYLVKGLLPPPDGSESAYDLYKAEFKNVQKGLVRWASDEEEGWAQRILEIRAEIKALSSEKDLIDQNFRIAMGEHERIQGKGWRMLSDMRAARHVEYDQEAFRNYDLRKVKI